MGSRSMYDFLNSSRSKELGKVLISTTLNRNLFTHYHFKFVITGNYNAIMYKIGGMDYTLCSICEREEETMYNLI